MKAVAAESRYTEFRLFKTASQSDIVSLACFGFTGTTRQKEYIFPWISRVITVDICILIEICILAQYKNIPTCSRLHDRGVLLMDEVVHPTPIRLFLRCRYYEKCLYLS